MWRICSSGVGPNSVNYLFKGKLWNESTEFAQLIQSQYTFEHSLIMNSHKQTTSLWFWHRFWIIDTKLRCFANSLNLSCLKSGIFLHQALSILELILRDDSIHPDMNMVYCVWNVNQKANSRMIDRLLKTFHTLVKLQLHYFSGCSRIRVNVFTWCSSS